MYAASKESGKVHVYLDGAESKEFEKIGASLCLPLARMAGGLPKAESEDLNGG